jgi:hypothetical protein
VTHGEEVRVTRICRSALVRQDSWGAGPFLAGFEKLLNGIDEEAGGEGDVDLVLRDAEGGRGGCGPFDARRRN